MYILPLQFGRNNMHHHKLRTIISIVASVIVTSNLVTSAATAQSNGKTRSLRGYSDANAATEITWEEKMRAVPKPELLREYMKHLSAEPHHVGSRYDKQNAEWIRDKFKSWGIEAKLEEFDVLFPTPTER